MAIPPEMRRRHCYVAGASGTGKSTLLLNMILQDIAAGHGVGVLDPHGDLVRAVLRRIPADRGDDVVLFDPSDQQYPFALNIAKNLQVSHHGSGLIRQQALTHDLISPHVNDFVHRLNEQGAVCHTGHTGGTRPDFIVSNAGCECRDCGEGRVVISDGAVICSRIS